MIDNKNILFWLGRGQSKNILKSLLEELSSNGYNIEYINFKYDEGDFSPHKWKQVTNNVCSWWMGISLGAALLYYCAGLVQKDIMPKRITLINPFYSRTVLAKEKGFMLNNQWDFNPIDQSVNVKHLDVVLSIYDEKIPIYHGIFLLEHAKSRNKNIVFIKDSHILSNIDSQLELATILLEGKTNERTNKNYYCDLYKQ